MDPTRTVGATERTRDADQRTDRRTDGVKPVYPQQLRCAGGIITIFWSRVRRFANNFHEWRSHKWKSLANRLRSEPKIFIHGNKCFILFLTCYFMSWTYYSTKNYYRSLISPLSLWTVFSDLVLWRHHSWSLTSHERRVLALWCHVDRLLLHARIGAKAIFMSEKQQWISISHQPVFPA